MAVIVVSDAQGLRPEMVEGMRQAGVVDRMKAAPGFRGHWSGPTDTGRRVIEIWETRDAWQAWFDGTIKPNLPPEVQVREPTFTELSLEVQPG